MTPNALDIRLDGIGAVSAPLQIVLLLTLISTLWAAPGGSARTV